MNGRVDAVQITQIGFSLRLQLTIALVRPELVAYIAGVDEI